MKEVNLGTAIIGLGVSLLTVYALVYVAGKAWKKA